MATYGKTAAFTKPSLSTPYGGYRGKIAARTKPISYSNGLSIPIVGDAVDLALSLGRQNRFDAWNRDVVQPHNAAGRAVITRGQYGLLGESPIAYADRFGKADVRFADQNFSEGNLSRIGEESFGRTLGGLRALPGEIRGQTDATLGEYGSVAGNINQRFRSGAGALDAGFGSLSGDVAGGYEALADRARGIVNSISDQQTQDANRRFSEEAADETGRLASQGLSGSTVGSSVRGGINVRRGEELRRIADQTARERLGVESTFGGAGLAAQQQIGLAGLGERGANLRFGTETARTLASDLAGKGIEAARLNSQTGLDSLRAQGVIDDSQYRTLIDGLRTRLDTRTGRTVRGVDARLGALNTAANFYGGETLVQPY